MMGDGWFEDPLRWARLLIILALLLGGLVEFCPLQYHVMQFCLSTMLCAIIASGMLYLYAMFNHF